MTDVDQLGASLLEESKIFLEKASLQTSADGRRAYLHASLALGFCALEAHVNSIADDMSEVFGIGLLDKAILKEKEIVLDDGKYKLGKVKFYRLEDRIRFLFSRFSKDKLDTKANWWSGLMGSIKHRNRLIHPKEAENIEIKDVKIALESIIGCISALFDGVYGKKFPASSRGLSSKLNF